MLLQAAMEELHGSTAFRHDQKPDANTLHNILNQEVLPLRRSMSKPLADLYRQYIDSPNRSSTMATLIYSSPEPSSPYYFSPLSYTTSNISQDYLISSPPRSPADLARTSDAGSTISTNTLVHQPHRIRSTIESSCSILNSADEVSDSSSTTSSTDSNFSTPDGNAILANCLLSITSAANADQPLKKEGMIKNASCIKSNNDTNLSFESPELEIQIDECPAAGIQDVNNESSIVNFIKRGGPGLMRSFSLKTTVDHPDQNSDVLKLNNSTDSPSHLRKYYSSRSRKGTNYSHGSLSKLAQQCSDSPNSMGLEKLFPLKRPQHSRLSQSLASSYETATADGDSPDDNSYMDALSRSLDSLAMSSSDHSSLERPAGQEVVIETINDKSIDFAYSPVASAFVFSPRRSAHNSPNRKPMTAAVSTVHTCAPPIVLSRSVSAKVYNSSTLNASNRSSENHHRQPLKPTLRKSNLSHDVNGLRGSYSMCDRSSSNGPSHPGSDSYGVYESAELDIDDLDEFGWRPAKDVRRCSQRINSRCGTETASPKISSVLLRHAEEAEEHFYDSRRRPPHTATCLPMRSFLGRAFLCRSKLGSSEQFSEHM